MTKPDFEAYHIHARAELTAAFGELLGGFLVSVESLPPPEPLQVYESERLETSNPGDLYTLIEVAAAVLCEEVREHGSLYQRFINHFAYSNRALRELYEHEMEHAITIIDMGVDQSRIAYGVHYQIDDHSILDAIPSVTYPAADLPPLERAVVYAAVRQPSASDEAQIRQLGYGSPLEVLELYLSLHQD